MAKKDIVQVTVKGIEVDIEGEGLGGVELSDLAGRVEAYMDQLDEIDTLKRAIIAAVHFAAQNYTQTQNEGGKRKEEVSRLNDLILKFKSALDTSQK